MPHVYHTSSATYRSTTRTMPHTYHTYKAYSITYNVPHTLYGASHFLACNIKAPLTISCAIMSKLLYLHNCAPQYPTPVPPTPPLYLPPHPYVGSSFITLYDVTRYDRCCLECDRFLCYVGRLALT